MALTLNDFVGFETGGLEEAIATANSPTLEATIVHTGDYSLKMDASADRYEIRAIRGTDAGDKYILGFWIYIVDKTPAILTSMLQALDASGGCWLARLTSGGVLEVINSLAALIGSTSDIVEGSWMLVEVCWEHSDTGSFDLYINGSSKISVASTDLNVGGSMDSDAAVYRFYGCTEIFYFDDYYAYSGAAGVSDFLGNCEVFRYQANTNSATPDTGDNLDTGVWQNCGKTPDNVDEVSYTNTPRTGAIYTDDAASGLNYRHGPHGDANIDGASNIKGGKWLHRLRRGTGGTTTHYKRYGNDVDGLTDAIVTPNTAYKNFMTISTLATEVPTDQEHFAQGFRVVGAQDIYCQEMWAFILHVPGAPPPAGGFMTTNTKYWGVP